ncbi:MAG TPA: glycosyl hydrolase family 18 protein [Candidatus Limnocylindria bacterium]|nr:glycosyl hydrolase family 18 protein [Candidatus Limnocylindria bacterium]
MRFRSGGLLLAIMFVATSAFQPVRAAEPTPTPSVEGSPAADPTPVPTAQPTPVPTAQPTPVPTPEAAPQQPSAVDLPPVHAEMLAEHEGDTYQFDLGGQPTVLLDGKGSISSTADAPDPQLLAAGGTVSATGLPSGLRRQVFGFLPYWMLTDADLAEMNYSLLSTVAYFSVGARSDGYLDKGTASDPSTGWAGWRSAQMTQVIDRAHARGVRVVLTVTMMAWDTAGYNRMRTLLNSSTYRARLAGQIADAVKSRGADGVNLDFELVPTDLKAAYTSFVRQVRAALVAKGAGRALTVCVTGGAATWATGYDVAGLVASGAADALFVMGYDYNWAGSSRAGGVAPIDSPYALDVSTAMADFAARAPASKLIWGVPYYGRGWSTTTNQLNGVTKGGSFAYYYTRHLADAGKYGRLWDAVGKVPWYRYYDSAKSSWIQVYYDDTTSLGVKYDLVNRKGMAGIGIWHLLMDGTRDELWRLIANRFVTDTRPPIGGVRTLPQRTTSNAIDVGWAAIDDQSGLSHYNVQVRERTSSVWSAWITGTHATHAFYPGQEGKTYEFRVQAVDLRGNAQPWLVAPGMPSSLRPGTFASVTTTTLNVRSGAGTNYAVVGTASSGDRVYILSGPVSAGGYTWWQVEYDWSTWPSTDYARIGWMAAGSGGDTYLKPGYAPSITNLAPFVSGYARSTASISPNGDGVNDGLIMRYTLVGPASAMRMDVVNASGSLVRSRSLGVQVAGPGQVAWDGRNDSGALVPNGGYLVRLVVTDAGGRQHVAPANGVDTTLRQRWGVTVDRTAPTVASVTPSPAVMVPAMGSFAVRFSEPMSTAAGGIRLELAGADVDASLTWDSARRTATIRQRAALPTNATVTLVIDGARDAAGNPVATRSQEYRTAPGVPLAEGTRIKVVAGAHAGYGIGPGGEIVSRRKVTFSSTSGAPVGQRATMPNLPGRWLYVEAGAWAGMWVPESAAIGVPGEVERTTVPTSTRLRFLSGSHTGVRFDAGGHVIASRTATLGRTSGANASARAIINGRAYWLVVNGIWAGYWIPESARAHVRGAIEVTLLASLPRVNFAPGTYSASRYASDGTRTASTSVRITRVSGAPIRTAAVINGVRQVLVDAGLLADWWVPLDARITFEP